MFRVPIGSEDADPVPIDRAFNLEVNYAYTDPSGRQQNAFFLIDIVNFEELPAFLAVIGADVEPMQLMLSN